MESHWPLLCTLVASKIWILTAAKVSAAAKATEWMLSPVSWEVYGI